MSTMSSRLVTGGILALIGLITIKVVMFIIGGTFAILALFFKLLPIVIVAWLAWKLIRYMGRSNSTDSTAS